MQQQHYKYPMRYWKYLDLDWRPASASLKRYVDLNPEILAPGSYFKIQDLSHVTQHVPEVLDMLKPLGVDLRFIAFFVQHTNNCNIHVDRDAHHSRINIPVMNCEYSETRFYTSARPAVQAFEASGTPYYYYDPEHCTCVDRYVLDGAILLRVREPHQVVIMQEHYPRISCSIGIKQDITYLLE